MPTYILNVTLRLTDDGEQVDTTTIKNMWADSEHQARRRTLEGYLQHGYQVVKITVAGWKEKDEEVD